MSRTTDWNQNLLHGSEPASSDSIESTRGLLLPKRDFREVMWENHERDEVGSSRTIPSGILDLFMRLTDQRTTLKVIERDAYGLDGKHS
jgi:hypothetical protein